LLDLATVNSKEVSDNLLAFKCNIIALKMLQLLEMVKASHLFKILDGRLTSFGEENAVGFES
jgi:hypothetical protein